MWNGGIVNGPDVEGPPSGRRRVGGNRPPESQRAQNCTIFRPNARQGAGGRAPARARSVGPEGAGAPPDDSVVTRMSITGRGTRGGLSVATVARPDSSGRTTPALTAAPCVAR